VYHCQGQTIGHRVVDITHLGATVNGLPVSLGLRPQAMKMKFVTPHMAGSFLRCSLRLADMLAKVGKHTSGSGSGQLFHRAYIGEAFSLIYLPLFVQERKENLPPASAGQLYCKGFNLGLPSFRGHWP
jgi:hypothetical protein